MLEISSVLDPLQSWNFSLLFPVIPGSSDTRDITYKVMSSSIPGTGIEQVSVESHGIKLNYAGRRTWTGNWACTIFETRVNSTRTRLINWMELARSWRNNSGSYKSQYGVTAELQLHDDIPNIARSVRIYGVWPQNVDDVNLDQQAAVINYNVQFSYDFSEEFEGEGN
jgi:hypothetical protein